MSETLRPNPAPSPRPEGADRLDSWKEIASYLGREVRTVQGWEKNEGLPIHRHQHAKQGSVYAFKSELDAWRKARKSITEAPVPVPEARPPRRWMAAAGLAILLLSAGFLFWKIHNPRPSGEQVSSVAVLPFLDLSPAKDQEYFSDGLTEEIIDGLSRVPNLRVVARTSAFAFKGKNTDIRQIGQQLNVDTVLEGSVRKASDQLRITAQLNRVSDGTHLWSRTYDRQLRDVLGVQREISQAIADQLRAGQVPPRQSTRDPEAYRLYQEGRYFFNQQLPPDSNQKAIDRYQQAIHHDPQFALAYSGIADAYAYLAEFGILAPKQVMPQAKEAAEKAVALDDSLAEAHTSLGTVKLDYERDRDGAQREFRRAMELNPGSAWARHWYAHSLEAQGRLDEAMKEMRAALALDPLSVVIHWDIDAELNYARRYDEALEREKKDLELFPDHPLLQYFEAMSYFLEGDVESGGRVAGSMKDGGSPDFQDTLFIGLSGYAAARQGRTADARKALDRLEGLRKTQYVDFYVSIHLCSALHDHQNLMLWLNRGYEERSAFWAYAPLLSFIYAGDPEAEAFIKQHRQ